MAVVQYTFMYKQYTEQHNETQYLEFIYLFIYLASVLSHLVTMDLSRFVQVEYSLINNEHKLDTLTITT